ncbi:hypothetical protein AB3H33_26465 [Escherichia coli]
MPSVSRYRTWLAVPADEIEDLKKAHPLMEGRSPVIWDEAAHEKRENVSR